MLTIVIITITIALLFDFLNGMNDAANSIATVVSTKVLSPWLAVIWAAFFNFVAAFIFGVHVANTIGKGIVHTEFLNEYMILAALIGAVVWVYSCTRLGLPISVSHALIGGLIGPALLVGGPSAIIAKGIIKVSLFIVLSPLIGMLLAYFISVLTYLIFRKTPPRKVDSLFRVLQLFSAAVFSLGHGTNDAQKTMGIIAVLLFTTGYLGSEFYVPIWVILSAHAAIALGTLAGGWKVIKTLGLALTHLKPFQGFCAETAGAITIIGSSLGGIPVSTTHTITGSIIGVGMTKRLSAVRWGIAGNIVIAWVLTIPGSMAVAAGTYAIISLFLS
jgi:PiT family inorganic phosphate transporter